MEKESANIGGEFKDEESKNLHEKYSDGKRKSRSLSRQSNASRSRSACSRQRPSISLLSSSSSSSQDRSSKSSNRRSRRRRRRSSRSISRSRSRSKSNESQSRRRRTRRHASSSMSDISKASDRDQKKLQDRKLSHRNREDESRKQTQYHHRHRHVDRHRTRDRDSRHPRSNHHGRRLQTYTHRRPVQSRKQEPGRSLLHDDRFSTATPSDRDLIDERERKASGKGMCAWENDDYGRVNHELQKTAGIKASIKHVDAHWQQKHDRHIAKTNWRAEDRFERVPSAERKNSDNQRDSNDGKWRHHKRHERRSRSRSIEKFQTRWNHDKFE